MKKIIAAITILTVAVLPIATAGNASAITAKKASVSIGGYCC